MSKLAPWKDFAGAPIFEGDTIRHPSGEQGIVVFVPTNERNPWRVRYTDDVTLALCLQIGDRGQAVVVADMRGGL